MSDGLAENLSQRRGQGTHGFPAFAGQAFPVRNVHPLRVPGMTVLFGIA
jgi:hypothetical protein